MKVVECQVLENQQEHSTTYHQILIVVYGY